MKERIRRFIESILYAGLKPNDPYSAQAPAAPPPKKRLARLVDPINRFITGPKSTDPLYLSNRTWQQKLIRGIMLGLPALAILVGLVVAASNIFAPKRLPPKEPTAAELIAKLLPDIEKTANVPKYTDAEVTEVIVDRIGPPMLRGRLHNKTDHVLAVEFVVDITDENGSHVASEAKRVSGAMPQQTVSFELPLDQKNAAFALVRDVHTVQ